MSKKIQSINTDKPLSSFKELSTEELQDIAGGANVAFTGGSNLASTLASITQTGKAASAAVKSVSLGGYASSAYNTMMKFYPY